MILRRKKILPSASFKMGPHMVMHSQNELQCAKYNSSVIPDIFGALEFVLTVHDHVQPHLEG